MRTQWPAAAASRSPSLLHTSRSTHLLELRRCVPLTEEEEAGVVTTGKELSAWPLSACQICTVP